MLKGIDLWHITQLELQLENTAGICYGLPVGVQFIAEHAGERLLLALAAIKDAVSLCSRRKVSKRGWSMGSVKPHVQPFSYQEPHQTLGT